MRFVILFAALLSLSACKTVSGSSDAVQQAQDGRYFSDVLAQAESGSVQAQYEVGDLYLKCNSCDYGATYPCSPQEGLVWLNKAAASGSKDAQRRLGEFYGGGFEGPRNLGEAEKWFTMAAGQGDDRAKVALAWLHKGTVR